MRVYGMIGKANGRLGSNRRGARFYDEGDCGVRAWKGRKMCLCGEMGIWKKSRKLQ